MFMDEVRALPRARLTEDWLAVLLGLGVVIVASLAFAGLDPLGWVVKTKVWTALDKCQVPTSSNYAGWSGWTALVVTMASLVAVLSLSAMGLGMSAIRFCRGFIAVLAITLCCYAIGNFAYIAATKDKFGTFGIGWSLNLTGEAGYLIALLVGLVIGNTSTAAVTWMREAIRPELYIKIAIVLLGTVLGPALSLAGLLVLAEAAGHVLDGGF